MQTVKGELAASIPPDWYWKESITLLAGDGEANVIFSSEPIDPGLGLEEYAMSQGKVLAENFPAYREIAFEPMTMMGGRPGRLRRFEWRPPDKPPMTQIQLYCVEGDRGYSATATTPTAHIQAAEPVLVGILERLTVERAAA